MAVSRLSISMPIEAEERIRAAADHAGLSVSAWVVDVATHAAIIEQGKRGVREYEAEYGAFSPEASEAADAILDRLGVTGP